MVENYLEILYDNEVLEGERIRLRKFAKADVDDVFAYASDEEATKYLTWGPFEKKKQALHNITDFYWSRPGIYAIELKSENKCLGCIDICLNIKDEKCEFGYVLNRHYWGHGYMTEALNLILSLCFDKLDLNRVEALHYTPNIASGKVMQKCGMKHEGTFIQEVKVKGVFYDCEHYGITQEMWKNR
ncbi:GNAT family N-acetyltransferase [Scatolibacter rhodanostii]|uniref:GNAT family N-acetyltransferase n=1 Tax=Scatolibacter rhodanostii TaxID=2014781 RepID=UPI000C07719C|nr:GNAT family protein [Scatolibacter rhodanostii]